MVTKQSLPEENLTSAVSHLLVGLCSTFLRALQEEPLEDV